MNEWNSLDGSPIHLRYFKCEAGRKLLVCPASHSIITVLHICPPAVCVPSGSLQPACQTMPLPLWHWSPSKHTSPIKASSTPWFNFPFLTFTYLLSHYFIFTSTPSPVHRAIYFECFHEAELRFVGQYKEDNSHRLWPWVISRTMTNAPKTSWLGGKIQTPIL